MLWVSLWTWILILLTSSLRTYLMSEGAILVLLIRRKGVRVFCQRIRILSPNFDICIVDKSIAGIQSSQHFIFEILWIGVS